MGKAVVAMDNMAEGSGPYPRDWKRRNRQLLEALAEAEDSIGTMKFVSADIRDRDAVEAVFQGAPGGRHTRRCMQHH